MNPPLRRAGCGIVLAVAVGLAAAQGPVPAELSGVLPAATLAGNSRFTYWGFTVYDATLWVAPGFRGTGYDRYAFALELRYLRDFTNEAITQRSVDEMRRQGATATQLATWQGLMHGAFPDVRSGDRIVGIHRPGEGAIFLTNGKQTGSIRDADFSRMFFGIWLSAQTSEPGLRDALLARTAP